MSASSVHDAFQASAAVHADRPFLHIPAVAARHYSSEAVDYTYLQAAARITALKSVYAARGYGPGHRIAMWLENRAEFFLHWLALNGLGVSAVPLNGEMTADEQAYLLAHSDACAAIVVDEHESTLRGSVALLDAPIPVVGESALESFPEARTAAENVAVSAETECAMLYTSGSTGRPKGCILSNDYYLRMGAWYRDLGGLCAMDEGSERLLTPLPLVHMNAMATSTMGMVITGGCIIQLDRFHPSSWWDSVRRSRASIIHYLGVMPAILLNMPAEDDEDFSGQLKFGFGAGVNPKHHAPFEQRFGFPLVEGWAMTESGSGGIIMAHREPRKVGTACIGRPMPEVDVRLADDDGNDVAAGEDGELLVRAAGDDPRRGFFSGYYKNPAETDKIWEEGWLHTGDVVRQDKDGDYHFVDRKKNVIRRSGENISALEVEAVLAQEPHVDAAGVTAVPDEMRGDEVAACIVLASGQAHDENTAHAIFEHCQQKLVYYKTPGYIVFVDALPLTPSQKPRRGDIKVLARERVAEGRCIDLRRFKRRPAAREAS